MAKKTATLTADLKLHGSGDEDYFLDGRLFMCRKFVKHVLGKTPEFIKIKASLTPDPKAKKVFIRPGYKSWGWTTTRDAKSCSGMYSEMARQLAIKLGVNALGTEKPWFDVENLEPLTKPIALYVTITRV